MIGRYRRELSVAATYAVLLMILAWRDLSAVLRGGPLGFYDPGHLLALVVSNAPLLVATVGMTLVILARQIDISIGSQFCICGVVAGLLAKAGLSMPLASFAALLTGAGMGAANGALVAGLGLPSIVVTLATFAIFRESLRWTREGAFVHDLPAGFQWFGAGQQAGQWLVVGIALVVFLICAWGLRHLRIGRNVYATGSDPEAARLVGIRPRRTVFGVFVVMGVLAALAALLNAVRFPDVDPNAGTGKELQVIAAVVVGGVAISGGRGTLAGSLIGVVLLGSIGPALSFLHIQPQWEKAIQGLIILAAVATDALPRRGK